MEYFSIKNWETFQHYTSRNPPWIKLYHSLLDDYEYGCLQDASKLLLISLFMLASRTGNKIPLDHKWIKQKAMLTIEPDLKPLLDAGFINYNGDASKLLAICKQDASPIREEKRREDTARARARAREILTYLNEKTGHKYERTVEIEARLNEGKTVEQCKKIIDIKLEDSYFQQNPDFYHPSTLFRKGHWDKYINSKAKEQYS